MNEPAIESVAKAMVINNENEALILTVGEHKERPEKSFKPDLPGGLVDPGESERNAVAREINEETGIIVDQPELIMVYSRTQFIASENKSVTKHLFIVRLSNKPDVKLSWEHSEYNWVPLGDLQTKELRSFYDEAIKYCFSHNMLSISS